MTPIKATRCVLGLKIWLAVMWSILKTLNYCNLRLNSCIGNIHYDYRIVIYDHRSFLRLVTGLVIIRVSNHWDASEFSVTRFGEDFATLAKSFKSYKPLDKFSMM